MLKHFPINYTPTREQVSNLERIEEKFYSNKKFLIIQAPTGTGKSMFAGTICNIAKKASKKYIDLVKSREIYKTNLHGNYINADQVSKIEPHGCFVLTITKALQDQYIGLFNDLNILKGKNNYTCEVDSNCQVDTAPCVYLSDLKKKCLSEKTCTYYNALDKSLTNSFSCLSYSKYLSLPDHLKRRQFLVLDEASEIEFQLVKEFTYILPHRELKRYGINFTYSPNKGKLFENLFECYNDIGNHLSDIKKHISKKKNNYDNDSKLVIEYKRLSKIQLGLKTLLRTYSDSKYIIEKDNFNVTFTPLKIDLLSKHIFDHAEKIVLMSATFVGVKNFVKTLGIGSDDYDYISINSEFDSSKSKIKVSKDTPLNYENIDYLLPKLIKRIETLLDKHSDVKGIIHTQSRKITEFLQTEIDKKYLNRLLIREPGVKNEELLHKHISTERPTVLVSPSMTYGVDLKDNLGRFQIIIKLPYLPLTDKRVKLINKVDKNWYTLQMFNNLIQACGRTTRNKEDYSITYIMDSNFLSKFEIYYNELPEYFRKRCEN